MERVLCEGGGSNASLALLGSRDGDVSLLLGTRQDGSRGDFFLLKLKQSSRERCRALWQRIQHPGLQHPGLQHGPVCVQSHHGLSNELRGLFGSRDNTERLLLLF
jgi:hypothetical protein